MAAKTAEPEAVVEQAEPAPETATAQTNGRVPHAVRMEPPKMEGRGKTAIHSEEVIREIAEAAAEGWTSNGLTYKTKHGAQGALQTVKEAIVKQGFAANTSDLSGRVWESGPGQFVFAIGAKAAVRSQ